MPFRDIRDYHRHIVNRVATSGLTSLLREVHTIKVVADGKRKNRGYIRAAQLTFPDGAAFRINEEIEIVKGEVLRLSYSYQYVRTNGYYFRYDKDPNAANPPHHAETHLHVIQEEPRYITHSTSFDEVFDFIIACFYTSSAD